MQETQARSLGQEDSLKKEIATYSSIPAWEIPGTEEPGGLRAVGSQRQDLAAKQQCVTKENLLCCTGDFTWCSAVTYMGGKSKGEGRCVYVWQVPFVVQQNLTQHYKATILYFFFKSHSGVTWSALLGQSVWGVPTSPTKEGSLATVNPVFSLVSLPHSCSCTKCLLFFTAPWTPFYLLDWMLPNSSWFLLK